MPSKYADGNASSFKPDQAVSFLSKPIKCQVGYLDFPNGFDPTLLNDQYVSSGYFEAIAVRLRLSLADSHKRTRP